MQKWKSYKKQEYLFHLPCVSILHVQLQPVLSGWKVIDEV